jgi:hypothetical protein
VVPVSVPPLLLKSVPLLAKQKFGRNRHDSNRAGRRNLPDKRIARLLDEG